MRTLFVGGMVMLAGCAATSSPPPSDCATSFSVAVERNQRAVRERDLRTFMSTLAPGDGRLMILPDGTVWDSHQAVAEGHRQWFADPSWTFHTTLRHREEREHFGVVAYDVEVRRPDTQVSPFLLAMVFAETDGCWYLVHDQNTPLSQKL